MAGPVECVARRRVQSRLTGMVLFLYFIAVLLAETESQYQIRLLCLVWQETTGRAK